MGFLLWLLYGAIIGWIASIITRNNARMGFILNIIVGLIGAFIGGWIASALNIGSFASWSFYGMLISIGGAVLLLLIVNLIRGRR
jgi:uncharacterized membrane protein YeaQ/YmgE (transglycosylase-associated protein family)